MNAVFASVIRHRKPVIVIFCVLAALAAVLQLGVGVNYNMTDYLPKKAPSTEALSLLEAEFPDAIPNARVMLRNVTVTQALAVKRQLATIDGVTDVVWLDDVLDLKTPLETLDKATVEAYYKDGDALLSLTVRKGDEVAVTEKIYEIIGPAGALSGNAVDMAEAQKLTGSETRMAMIILIPVIILILIVTTRSWMEPVLYLASIGISVLINMGANVIFGEISFLTNAISPILQLAVSLDYAIFLMHSFEDFRKQTADPADAMRLAMKQSFSSVAASAATTFFGFLALMFMKFRIGSDLGIVLVKGIVLSFLSVMVFLPALTLVCLKLLDKTKHRRLLPELGRAGKVLVKLRIPALILVALLIIPGYLAQRQNNFVYGASTLAANSRSGADTEAIEGQFGRETTIVLLVPRGDPAREALLSEALKNTGHVTGVISYATAVGVKIPDAFLDAPVSQRFYSDNYSRIIVYTDTADEGSQAFDTVAQVTELARSYYDTVYATGQSVMLYDMKNVVTADNTVVNLIAIATILLVLLFTFRSASIPLILIVTIETAIWINLSVPYFAGSQLVYIGYLVINTVQLGATVDYAILTTNHYAMNRRLLPKKEALLKTYGQVITPVLTSGAILALAGFALRMTSSNQIVAEMGLLLGRGTLLSMLMTLVFLPGVLSVFDGLVQKTTYQAGFRSDTL